MFNIVLVAPEIPANTGNIARTCLAAGARLHLIEPLGFKIDDRSLRRAGLDYWKDVDVSVWSSLEEFFSKEPAAGHEYYLTTKTTHSYTEVAFAAGDYLIFGRETKGLPEPLLAAHPDRLLTIPMEKGTRSLNLATSVGIVLFEALRQTRNRPNDERL